MRCLSASISIPRAPTHCIQPALNKSIRRRLTAARANGNRSPQGQEANGVLDAFFLGKAVAETLNERVGAVLGEVLSEITKANAERDYAWRSFQQEVQQRADREKESRTGISLGALPTSSNQTQTAQVVQPVRESPAATSGWRSKSQALRDADRGTSAATISEQEQLDIDLQELADDLRADIASARANLQQLKMKRPESNLPRQIRP